MFLGLHRNKRSIVLDLKSNAGRAAFQRLAGKFDVILHNFRPNVAKRLGATFEQLKTVNSSVVVCKVYGYGEGGAYAERPAYDDVIQAGSGIADLFQRVRGEPQYVPSMICDKIVGQAAATAILAACYQRLAHATSSVKISLKDWMRAPAIYQARLRIRPATASTSLQ